MNKRVLIWSTKIQDLIEEKSVGGITVQLYFWANIFKENGWTVFSLTKSKAHDTLGISFIPIKEWKSAFEFVHEWLRIIYLMLKYRPDVILFRGAQRELLPLVVIGRITSTKVIFFSASDANFKIGEEQVFGSPINLKMYRKAVKKADIFVVQNVVQQESLLKNYGKTSLCLSNIWGVLPKEETIEEYYDVIWVANFRRLKRPEWVINVAKELPKVSFCMVGASWGDDDYYKTIKEKAKQVKNLCFLGGRSFFVSDALIKNSKLLICTSEFEGFPNTFLQAWSHGVPVVSTVDPNKVISERGLGMFIESENDLKQAILALLGNKGLYADTQRNINEYFHQSHNPQKGYNELIKYIKV